MKKVVFYIVLFCVVIMLSGFKYESAVEQQISVAERNGISDALPESAEKLLESLGLDDISADSLSNLPLDDIIRLIGESIKEEVKAPFIAIVSVCAAGILCRSGARCFTAPRLSGGKRHGFLPRRAVRAKPRSTAFGSCFSATKFRCFAATNP